MERFVRLKYQMPEGHLAGGDWQLGIAGPYFKESLPYEGEGGVFARVGDRQGEVDRGDWLTGISRWRQGKMPNE